MPSQYRDRGPKPGFHCGFFPRYLQGMDPAGQNSGKDTQVTASLEQRALEKLARVLCSHTQQLASAAQSRGALKSREAGLQREVFAERRAQVMSLLDTNAPDVDEPRMARLEKLIESIQFSRQFFMNV